MFGYLRLKPETFINVVKIENESQWFNLFLSFRYKMLESAKQDSTMSVIYLNCK